MVATLVWWGAAVAAPAYWGARALRLGRRALYRGDYPSARRWLSRAAARSQYEEAATCLLAETAIRARQPAEAIIALDGLPESHPREPSARKAALLRAIACIALRQGPAAQRALSPIADRSDATSDELLAMAHACIIAGDTDAARVFLTMLRRDRLAGPLRGRARLCDAAVRYHEGKPAEALALLPAPDECTEDDWSAVLTLREKLIAPAPEAPTIADPPVRPESAPAHKIPVLLQTSNGQSMTKD